VRVAKIEMHKVRIPLKREIRHASHSRNFTDNLVIKVTLDSGIAGYGEGLPRDYVTGETIDTSCELLKKTDFAGQLGDPQNWQSAVESISRFQLPKVPGDDRECNGNAARCALEIALLDAYGKHFGESLASLCALRAPELAESVSQVRYSMVITSAKGRRLALRVLGYWTYGFRQIKIKVGIPGYDDPKRVKVARSFGGRKMGIRLDANEAWTLEEALSELGAMKTLGIQWVEQPLRHEDCSQLAKLRSESGARVMLDESLCSRIDAERAIAGNWCDLFNLRISKCGGFLPTLELARIARRAGLSCQLGCQVGETAILSAAGRMFAQSVGGLEALEGSYDRHLVKEALGTKDLTFGLGGKAPALKGAGLGIELRPGALESVTLAKEDLWERGNASG